VLRLELGKFNGRLIEDVVSKDFLVQIAESLDYIFLNTGVDIPDPVPSTFNFEKNLNLKSAAVNHLLLTSKAPVLTTDFISDLLANSSDSTQAAQILPAYKVKIADSSKDNLSGKKNAKLPNITTEDLGRFFTSEPFIQAKEETKKEESKDEGEGKKQPMNKQIIEQIDRLMKYYQTQGDKGRMFAYRKAVTALKSIDDEIYEAD
jgi:hypothetical protein